MHLYNQCDFWKTNKYFHKQNQNMIILSSKIQNFDLYTRKVFEVLGNRSYCKLNLKKLTFIKRKLIKLKSKKF